MVGALSANVRYQCDHEIWEIEGKRYQYVYFIADAKIKKGNKTKCLTSK